MAPSYTDFEEFARAVLAHRNSHSDWTCLDGEKSGDNRKAWCYFEHMGRRWKVAGETEFLPIIFAHDHYLKTGEDPFFESQTETQHCLLVIDAVHQDLIRRDARYQRNKYLYVYSPREKH